MTETPAPPPAPAARPFSFDTTEASFTTDVVDRSDELPVVVDFWAPWCGPCRQLGPILERLVAGPFAGRIALAKVNTDENTKLAGQFSIRGIPAVKIFHRREMVAEFVGALPSDQISAILNRLVPGRADDRVAEALVLEKDGDLVGAGSKLREALDENRLHVPALLALGRILAASGDLAGAIDALERVAGNATDEAEAGRQVALLKLRQEAASVGSEAGLAALVATQPHNVEARYGLGLRLAARAEYASALEHLLEVVKLDRKFRDDAGRRAMLAVFDAAGSRSALSDEWRARLASALY